LKPYEIDLAYIHNQAFGDLARAASEEVLHQLKKRQIENASVIDLGCGSGILAKILTQAGHDVLGIDISSAMLKIAKANAPIAIFKRTSLFRAALHRCDVVVSVGECINYLFDQHNLENVEKLFKRIFTSLNQEGFFLLDFATPRCSEGKVFTQAKDWTVLVDKKINGETLTRAITIFRRDGTNFRRTQETHQVHLYEPETIKKLLTKTGFRVRKIRGYANQQFAKGVVGFLGLRRQ